MDGSDGLLVEGVEHYWRQNKQVPSEHWVRRRSNELTEERTNAEIKDQIPDVEAWLGASQGWRRAKPPMVKIPPMPDPTFHVVAPSEAADLCRRAKRDGLCVIDVIQNQLMEEDPYGERPEDALDEDELELYKEDPVFARSKAEGVCTLIVSTDPQRRTVVGLNEEGKCTSEHHCTGKNNAVDKIAWEYFK